MHREHAAALQAQLDAQRNSFTYRRTRDGGLIGRLRLSPYSAAVLDQWLARADRPHPGTDGFEDDRDPRTRRADTLVDTLAGSMARDAGAGAPPGVQIGVTLDYDPIRERVGDAVLDAGGTLTPTELRRLACDAAFLPIVLGGQGQPIDLGRATRTWSPAQRRAVIARDRGCAAPGCDRPPAACQIHHNIEWEHGGPTDIANAALLCLFHHQQVHRQGWTVTLANNGHPTFRPPRTIDPHQRPRQHHRYQLQLVRLRT